RCRSPPPSAASAGAWGEARRLRQSRSRASPLPQSACRARRFLTAAQVLDLDFACRPSASSSRIDPAQPAGLAFEQAPAAGGVAQAVDEGLAIAPGGQEAQVLEAGAHLAVALLARVVEHREHREPAVEGEVFRVPHLLGERTRAAVAEA